MMKISKERRLAGNIRNNLAEVCGRSNKLGALLSSPRTRTRRRSRGITLPGPESHATGTESSAKARGFVLSPRSQKEAEGPRGVCQGVLQSVAPRPLQRHPPGPIKGTFYRNKREGRPSNSRRARRGYSCGGTRVP